MAWVERYERAWRAGEVTAVADLFTADARYRHSPYEADKVGHDAIRAMWREDEGRPFQMVAEPVAVQDRTAVVRVQVDYHPPRQQQYRDLWVMRFAADGRVADFEEWAYWPGASYTAGSDD